MRDHDENVGGSQRIVLDRNNNTQIREGAPIRANMHGEWVRGRFEYDRTQGMNQAMINAGDKQYMLPEGTEIELV